MRERQGVQQILAVEQEPVEVHNWTQRAGTAFAQELQAAGLVVAAVEEGGFHWVVVMKVSACVGDPHTVHRVLVPAAVRATALVVEDARDRSSPHH
jgi:hypothetical protein